MSKLFSGRFLLTMVSAIVFMYLALADKMTAEQALLVINGIVIFYFTRTDRQPKG